MRRPAEQHHRRLHRQQRRDLDEERRDAEVREIGAPCGAKRRLLRALREEPLERDEDRRVHDHVQEKPVEAHVRCARACGCALADRHLRAAQHRGDERRQNARHAERLVLAQRNADDAKHEGADEHQVQQRPNVRQRIDGAELGDGQERRIVEAGHRAEPEEAKRGRRDAAHPAGAEVLRLERAQADAEWCHLVWINAVSVVVRSPPRGARKQTLPRRLAEACR